MSVQIEIKGYEMLIKKLEKEIQFFNQQAQKKREKLSKKTMRFKGQDVDSAKMLREMYEAGCCTLAEYEKAEERFKKSGICPDELSEEVAEKVLIDFKRKLKREIKEMEFDALPLEEQNRILEKRLLGS